MISAGHPRRGRASLVDDAAASLREGSRAFTRRNLFHAARRLTRHELDYAGFVAGPLARRLRAGPIVGLLPPPRAAGPSRPIREWSAYFPAAILIVDRREIVDLFAASGVLAQGRIAVVCVDGTPRSVVTWLRHGVRAGYRAPIGYLHDAATVLYPFAFEPVKTLIAALRAGEPLAFADLGLPHAGLRSSALPFCAGRNRTISELEDAPPAAIIGYAARRLAAMLPRDSWLAPIRPLRDRPRRAATRRPA